MDVVHEPLHRPKDLRCDCLVNITKQDGDSVYDVKAMSYDSNPFVSESNAKDMCIAILKHFAPHLSNPKQSISVSIQDCSSLEWVMAARIEYALKVAFPELNNAPPYLLKVGQNVPDQSTIGNFQTSLLL